MSKASFPSRAEHKSGSPKIGEPVFLAVGKLRRPHGLRGELLMDVWTDFPERLLPGVQLYAGESHQPLTIQKVRTYRQALLIGFAGVETPEDAGLYRNALVYVRSEDRPELPEGDYYHHQLLGMQVINEDGEILGVVTQILQTGSNDVYVVTPQTGKEMLLPAIDSVMLNVDLEKKQMTVRLLPGLEAV